MADAGIWYPNFAICEFGDQMWQGKSELHPDHLMRYKYTGRVKNYVAIDIHGRNRTFQWDLCKPLPGAWENQFDVVTAYHMLPHLGDQREAINNAIRLVRPGGVILFSLPTELSGWMPFGRYTYHQDFADKLAKMTDLEVLHNGSLFPFEDRPDWRIQVAAFMKHGGNGIAASHTIVPSDLAAGELLHQLGIGDTGNHTHTGNYTLPGRWAVSTDQEWAELDWMIDFMLQKDVKSVLTMGPEFGGVEWEMARRFQDAGRPLHILALDHRSQFMQQAVHYVHTYCPLIQFTGMQYDLNTPDMTGVLFGRYDFIFIDGDHAYNAVKNDFQRALRHTDKYIALHDILDAPHFGAGDFVAKLWGEIKQQYTTLEKTVNPQAYGIGIVDLTTDPPGWRLP